MTSFVFGSTTSGLPIIGYRFGTVGPRVLILGGVHGDEREGVIAALGLLKIFSVSFPYRLRVTLVPTLNLDGVIAQERRNGRGVDLNRNLPTKDWTNDVAEPRYYPGPHANSEPESRALTELLDQEPPRFILSLHSWKPMLNINGNCRMVAEAIAKHTGYIITESIGYPTPGCLGTYAGLERDLPTLTYEIERGLQTEPILRVHVPAILEGLKVCETRGS
ncbi:MAG: succinylglutamate desuccinylase/aspartoacylase family protein [Bdellovibrionaceae bacterium]|nr:succinylglutamate desuccinylase/aspartoacylase family protein [Pseudobdellovibrionaceae bacterium]